MINLLEMFSESELLLTNITFLGLKQEAWDYSRGARTERLYKCDGITDGTELRIKDYYNYTFTDGMRDVATVERHVNWYDVDGVTVIATKNVTKEFTPKSLGELNQKIRNGRITDLTSNALQLPSGAVMVDSLYAWYGALISDYIDRGSKDFENAVRDESDPGRRGLLDTSVPEFGGLTIAQMLSYQLVGGYTW